MIFPLLLQTAHIEVDPDRVLNHVTPAMYGACIEDVNHEIYGGLYAQRIFGESFEEPAPGTQPQGWGVYGGDWIPDGRAVHVRPGDGPKLVRQMPDLADGTVEAQVMLANDFGENAGLLVRVSRVGVRADDFDGYEVSISAKSRRLILGKHRHDFRLLRSVPAAIFDARWHRLRVELSGARIRVFLDEDKSPRIDFTDPEAPLPSGKVALRTWQADASFRGVRIDGRPAPISLAGEGVSRMWDRMITGDARPRFALEERAFNGTLCQKIVHEGGSGRVGVANRGLNRWGISIQKGHPMEGSLYLHGTVPGVTVALQSADGSRTYATAKLPATGSWKRAPFRLKPNATDSNARFAVWIERPGTVWLDEVQLFDAPADRFRGLPVRKDIADKLVASGLTFMRYGGSMVNVPGYRWKNMKGDPDRRPPYVGNWYPCSTNGFGIFDFLRFCEAAHLASAFAISANEAPLDAADLADYLTAPVNTLWGRRRAQDGHPAPYRPDYIEIGNEEAIGNPDADAMSRYAEKFRRLARAIHGRNPKLKLVCAAWWLPDAPQIKVVFDAVDGEAAAWDIHVWSDEPNAGLAVDRDLARVERRFKAWNPKTTLKAVVFEENGNRHDLQRALGHATTLNATRRHGDFVLADSAANALQPWRQNDNGWDQGGVFFTPSHAWLMPPNDVQRLLSEGHLPLRVAAKNDGPLDVLATRSEDGKLLALTVVNVAAQPVSAAFSFGRFHPRSAVVRTVYGDLTATNPPRGPKMVSMETVRLSLNGPALGRIFPPHSVTSIQVSRATPTEFPHPPKSAAANRLLRIP